MNLILLRREEIRSSSDKSAGVAKLPKSDARTKHIVLHLRKKTGDTVSVGVYDGQKGVAKVVLPADGSQFSEDADIGVILELTFDGLSNKDQSPSAPEITLLLALPQPKRLKMLWSTIASMGVTRIVLIRSTLSPFGEHCTSAKINEGTYRKLVEEGMMQGAHTRSVQVDVAVDSIVNEATLSQLGLISKEKEPRLAKIFLDCGDESGKIISPARDVVMRSCYSSCASEEVSIPDAAQQGPPSSAILAVGPERGWTDDDAKLFENVAGFEMASLGSSILRVDTAVVAGIAIVSSALDECHAHYEKLDNAEASADGANAASIPEPELKGGTSKGSLSAGAAVVEVLGREKTKKSKGGRMADPRMNKAIAAKISNDELSLREALEAGGFVFPTADGKRCKASNIVDADGVSLSQRKNQLSRRIRMLRQQLQKEEESADGKGGSDSKRQKNS